MRRLVVHLGLPKTATTSLQNQYLSRLPGYLGKSPHDSSNPALRELTEVYSFGDLIGRERVYEIDGRPTWGAALEKWVKEVTASNQEILLWSDEALSRWRSPVGNAAAWPVMDDPWARPRRGSHPIVGFLNQLRELLPQTIELKTILVLRRQSDWLTSLAAELGVTNTDFVERLILNDDACLDYFAITEDLERLRGPENHLTLMFENGVEHNLKEILQFAGYSRAYVQDLEVSETRVNVRRSKEGWHVRALTPLQHLEQQLQGLRDRFPVLDKHLGTNQALRRTLRPFLGYKARDRALGRIPALAKSVNLSLTERQRTAIKSHCEASNARLGARLDVDLKALGY